MVRSLTKPRIATSISLDTFYKIFSILYFLSLNYLLNMNLQVFQTSLMLGIHTLKSPLSSFSVSSSLPTPIFSPLLLPSVPLPHSFLLHNLPHLPPSPPPSPPPPCPTCPSSPHLYKEALFMLCSGRTCLASRAADVFSWSRCPRAQQIEVGFLSPSLLLCSHPCYPIPAFCPPFLFHSPPPQPSLFIQFIIE